VAESDLGNKKPAIRRVLFAVMVEPIGIDHGGAGVGGAVTPWPGATSNHDLLNAFPVRGFWSPVFPLGDDRALWAPGRRDLYTLQGFGFGATGRLREISEEP